MSKKYEHRNHPRNTVIRLWTDARRGRGSAVGEYMYAHCNSMSLSHYKTGRDYVSDVMWDRFVDGAYKVERAEYDNDIDVDTDVYDLLATYCGESKPKKSKVGTSTKKSVKQGHTNRVSDEEYTNLRLWIEAHGNLFTMYKETHNIDDVDLYSQETVDSLKSFISTIAVIDIEGTPYHHVSNWLTSDQDIKLRIGTIVYSHNFMDELDVYTNQFTRVIGGILNKDAFFYGLYEPIVKPVMMVVDTMIKSNHPFVVAARRSGSL